MRRGDKGGDQSCQCVCQRVHRVCMIRIRETAGDWVCWVSKSAPSLSLFSLFLSLFLSYLEHSSSAGVPLGVVLADALLHRRRELQSLPLLQLGDNNATVWGSPPIGTIGAPCPIVLGGGVVGGNDVRPLTVHDEVVACDVQTVIARVGEMREGEVEEGEGSERTWARARSDQGAVDSTLSSRGAAHGQTGARTDGRADACADARTIAGIMKRSTR